ncbi:ADP-ribosylglycohydrolase family protein [Streptomyces sp. NPDC008125]|uniref:ADP-ribosylglycohydrolase family protein n=1 Tax=Streptomyces sp. NPDC008125 TaxID=3364811 RepID=UPI0036EA7BBC
MPGIGSAVRRARVRGRLLGGAVGDAPGNPVEFLSPAGTQRAHGPLGVRGLAPDSEGGVGRITDDTRMTLFTVAGLIRAANSGSSAGRTGGVRSASLRWLDTQNHPSQ